MQKTDKRRQNDGQGKIKKPEKMSEERDYSALRQCCSPESEEVDVIKTEC